jgi:hypothetical protein
MTGRIGRAEQERQNRKGRTGWIDRIGQAKQDRQNRTVKTGQTNQAVET